MCDWYLEMSKEAPNKKLLRWLLTECLMLLHPFVPLVTERIWQELSPGTLLAERKYKKIDAKKKNEKLEEEFALLQVVVGGIRKLRAGLGIDAKQYITAQVITEKHYKVLEKNINTICRLTMAKKITITKTGSIAIGSSYLEEVGLTMGIPLTGNVSKKMEKKRLEEEQKKVQPYLESLEKKLANDAFVKGAPKRLVKDIQEKKDIAAKKIAAIKARLQKMK